MKVGRASGIKAGSVRNKDRSPGREGENRGVGKEV